MPHDGQDMPMTPPVLLSDLLDLTNEAVPTVEKILDNALETVRELVSKDGRVNNGLIEANQTASHGLAWLATYVESLRQMQKWAIKLKADGKFGETEQLIHQIAFGEYLLQIQGGIQMNQGEVLRMQDLGIDLGTTFETDAIKTLMAAGNTQAARSRLSELIEETSANLTVGASGLDEELEMIREQFRRFSVDRVEPYAHEWHLKDELIPMKIIEEMAELGVFGLTIPEEFGGFGL